MLIAKKFDETSMSPLSIVLSAFNDLCLLIGEKQSLEENQLLYEKLQVEFGAHFFLLARTIPNVLKFSMTEDSFQPNSHSAGEEGVVNYFTLCDQIKRFMRIVSSMSCPVMIFFDDCQWSDAVSLGLVHTVLSDKPGDSCVLFVGSYRDNEVNPDHIIFDFIRMLSLFDVPFHNTHLDGMPESEVNGMISDALRMLPRMCQSLSQAVFRKTKGNPFFVWTFLRTLHEKGLLTFSLREKCWIWDADDIFAQNITQNVLELLTATMVNVPQNVQVGACLYGDASLTIYSLMMPHHYLFNLSLVDCTSGGIVFRNHDEGVYCTGLVRHKAIFQFAL
jgi:hypothetical protein